MNDDREELVAFKNYLFTLGISDFKNRKNVIIKI